MTPEEKAEELIVSFLSLGCSFSLAKKCSLIVVSEIIVESNPDAGFLFWQDVKQEIEKK